MSIKYINDAAQKLKNIMKKETKLIIMTMYIGQKWI